MWPDLFGSGWVWNVLISGASLACIFTLTWLLPDARSPQKVSDPLQRIWQRYEQGDLTRYEFERSMQAHAPHHTGPAGHVGAEAKGWTISDPAVAPRMSARQSRLEAD